MANIRENARSGAALFTLFTAGCLSTDEPLFKDVAAPEERMNPGAMQSALPSGMSGVVQSSEQQPTALDFAPPSATAPSAAPPASAAMPVPAGDEAEVAVTPFAPCEAPGLLSCDTFEERVSAEFPSGDPWQAELQGCGTHVVDESGVSHSGSKALRADSGGYPECMLHVDLEGDADVFVRSWIRIGSEPELLQQYMSLLEWGPQGSQDEPEVRIGLRPNGGSVCPTTPGLDVSVSVLAAGSATDCTGVGLEAEQWYCVQAHLALSEAGLSVSLALDGETLLEQDYSDLAASWRSAGLFFKLGRAAYGASARGSLWHDDVAVGREPMPCGPRE